MCAGRPWPIEDRAVAQLAVLDAEHDALMGRLAVMRPATLDGVRARWHVSPSVSGSGTPTTTPWSKSRSTDA